MMLPVIFDWMIDDELFDHFGSGRESRQIKRCPANQRPLVGQGNETGGWTKPNH